MEYGDLISRQAAIDAIDRLDISEDMCVFEILSHIEVEIGTLPSAQSEQRWVSCSERLPEDSDYHDLWETPDGAVLWCKATGEIGIGWYYESTKNWCDLWDNGVKDVIAWMPLPEVYERGDD